MRGATPFHSPWQHREHDQHKEDDAAFCLCLTSSHFRLQDLTIRDLEKHEREKSANSLESFVFETQVRVRWAAKQVGMAAGGRAELAAESCICSCVGEISLED